MTDRIRDAFLNAAIECEVNGLSVLIGQRAEINHDMRIGMAALEARNQLVEKGRKFHLPSGPGLSFFNKARFISLSRSMIDKISPTRRVISAVRPSGL